MYFHIHFYLVIRFKVYLSKSISPVLPYSTTIGFYCLDDDCGPRTFCHKMYDILQFEIMAIKLPFNIENEISEQNSKKFQFEFFSDIHIVDEA